MSERFSAERTDSGWHVRDSNATFDATLRELYPAVSRQDARRMARELNEMWVKIQAADGAAFTSSP